MYLWELTLWPDLSRGDGHLAAIPPAQSGLQKVIVGN